MRSNLILLLYFIYIETEIEKSACLHVFVAITNTLAYIKILMRCGKICSEFRRWVLSKFGSTHFIHLVNIILYLTWLIVFIPYAMQDESIYPRYAKNEKSVQQYTAKANELGLMPVFDLVARHLA